MTNYNELKSKIEGLIDSGYNKTIKETNGLVKLTVGPTGVVDVEIALKEIDSDSERDFKIALTKLVKLDLGFPGIKIKFTRNDYLPKGEKRLTYIGIASGKGGVGKSTVTANLAYALKRLGKRVGIVDADVYGATIADIYEIPDAKPTGTSEEYMNPPISKGIEIISTAFFVDKGSPVMWRGPMLGKLLNHFFTGVNWHENTDYILIDLPPGTGDTALDVQKFAPQTKMIIVTTPHINASSVALKAGLGAKKIGHELLGVVENMSYYINPVNKEKEYIFGQGGGNIVSEKLQIDLLAELPISQPKNGFLYEADEPNGLIYDNLAKKVIKLVDNN